MIPASFFGMPLGLLALGLAWRAAAGLWPMPTQIGEILVWSGSALWLLLFVAYLAKWLWRRPAARAEFAHPVQCCFVGLAGVVASLAAIGMLPRLPSLAFVLFLLGLGWTLAFALYRTGGLWLGERKPEETTPVLYLPSVAGSLVSASAAAAFGYADAAQLLFGAGLFAWLAIESIVIHRLYTAAPMPPALRPTLGIQFAPPAVTAVAYLNVAGGAPDLFAHALLGYALLQALILLRLARWLSQSGATPAWWALSFGVAALPTAAIKLAARGDGPLIQVLAPWLFGIGNLTIAALLCMTLYLMLSGRLLPQAPAATAAPARPATGPAT